jgi:Fe2+ transport system protein FeoA
MIIVIGGFNMSHNKTMRLSDSKKGFKVILKKISIEKKLEEHLKNLGLVPGTTMDIFLNTSNGTVVIVRDGKLALGKEISECLEVDVIHEQVLR